MIVADFRFMICQTARKFAVKASLFWKIAEKCRILQIEYGKYKTSKDCTTAAKGIE